MKENKFVPKSQPSFFLNGFLLGSIFGFSSYYFLKVSEGQKSAQKIYQKIKKTLKETQKELKKNQIPQKLTKFTSKAVKQIEEKAPQIEKNLQNLISQTENLINSEAPLKNISQANQNSVNIAEIIRTDLEKKASSLEKKFFTKKGKKIKK